MLKTNKIKPFLWFERQAEEAVKFYSWIFKRSKIGKIARYPQGSFIALNGGPIYRFNEAVSFSVERLVAGGGRPVQCGWLKDRYGLSWQVARCCR